jgi:hypothetical protein
VLVGLPLHHHYYYYYYYYYHLHLLEKLLKEDNSFLGSAHINQSRGPRTTDFKQTTR